ncbi:MAG TPA: (E)-4-hydroxy-3-methylbut-2-enyl-diphosphate synthase [Bacteroidales bacterium]
MSLSFKYCNSLTEFSRFVTKEVNVGGVCMGGSNPIRVQSMTNTPTLDTNATVEQCIRIINAGADYVRITAPGVQDAQNLAAIKSSLRKRGYKTPLIADIHFNPQAAEVAAAIVEKVRINPGNYADKKRFELLEYTDVEYKLELERIRERLLPLLRICKEHGTAIRIGVNHGSLSDRIMSRYGDTPMGMVEAAMEFLRICKNEGFDQLVVSLKASNTRIMVQAYRLLVATMMAEDMNYPLHLGVTEAGDGEDGRIKSAVGIGALLADGLGDTVRVSLTEVPELEIPVAKNLVDYFSGRKTNPAIDVVCEEQKNPFEYKKRESIAVENVGGNNTPIVIVDYQSDITNAAHLPAEYVFFATRAESIVLKDNKRYITSMNDWFKYFREKKNVFPFYTAAQYLFYGPKHPHLNFVVLSLSEMDERMIEALKDDRRTVVIVETFNTNGVAEQRALLYKMLAASLTNPVIINRNYCEYNLEMFQIKAAADVGLLLIDGLGDGIWIRNAAESVQKSICALSLGILQATRLRMSKTEYISCPSCGRTMFDLQATTARIKQRTSHLRHLKIGIMGCIVNGPGEMADADYGYVGAAAGKVTLYKGKEVVRKNIPSEEAVDQLIDLIREHGDWVEP